MSFLKPYSHMLFGGRVLLLSILLFQGCIDFTHPKIGREYLSPKGNTVIKFLNEREMVLEGSSLKMEGTYSIKGKELRFDFTLEKQTGFLLFTLKKNKIISEDKKFTFHLIPSGSLEKQNKTPEILNTLYQTLLTRFPQGIPKNEIEMLPLTLTDIQTFDYFWKVCIPEIPCEIPQFPYLNTLSKDLCMENCFVIIIFNNLDNDSYLDIALTTYNIKKMPNNRPYSLFNDLINWKNEILINRLFMVPTF